MQRLVARFLLILVLVGVLAPVGLAATLPNPHACCKRHPMADAAASGVQIVNMQIGALPACCNHDCCRSMTISQWANVARPATRQYAFLLSPSLPDLQVGSPAAAMGNTHSSRAPPLRFSN
jgi:hypothetical protein